MKNKVFVFDTNSLISALLSPKSTNAEALKKELTIGVVVYSAYTFTELVNVLFRSKFDKYFSLDDRKQMINLLEMQMKEITVYSNVKVCRDPKDDIFLNLAIDAKANFIITGDSNLLIIIKYENFVIVNASTFLNDLA